MRRRSSSHLCISPQVPSPGSSPASATTSERASNTNHGNDPAVDSRCSRRSRLPSLAGSPRNLLPLRLDERKDCEFALPFHYEGNATANPGRCLHLFLSLSIGLSVCDADLDDEDDDTIMRRVLAISQIEYVETLKKQRQPPKSDDPNGPSSSSDTHLL